MFPRSGGFSGLMPRSRFNYAREVGDGTRSSVVIAPLRWLQRNFTQATFRLRRFDGDQLVTVLRTDADGAGRLLSLLRRPNPVYGGRRLWKATLLSYELDGNAYWYKVRNGMGAVIQLWYIPHTLIEPVRDTGSAEYLDGFDYRPDGGQAVRLPVADVVHFADGIDPDNTLKGMSPFRSLLREVFTDDEAANYTASILRNMGVPGLVIAPENSDDVEVSADDVRETKRRFQQATTGDNRGEPIVMSAATRVTTFGFNPQQMDTRTARRLPEERVTAVLGIPAIVAGLGAGLDRSTFSNMEEARSTAAEEKLVPTCGDLADIIAHQLLPDFVADVDRYEADFDTSQVQALSENADRVADRMVKLAGGPVATVAEAREAVGLPVEDEHQIYLRPFSVMEIPVGGSREVLAPVADATTEPAKARRSAGTKAVTQRAQQGYSRAMQAVQARVVAHYADRIASVFRNLGEDVARAFAREYGSGKDDLPAGITPAMIAAADRALLAAGIETTHTRALAAEYASMYQLVASETMRVGAATMGLGFNAPDLVTTAVMEAGGLRIPLVGLAEQSRDALFAALADGAAEGEGVAALERRIRGYVTGGGPTASVDARALRIARTEVRYAANVSAVEAARDQGFGAVMMLDNRLGDSHDEDAGDDGLTCVERDGMVVDFDTAQAAMDAEHPNGTLDIVPATDAQTRDMEG